MQFADIYADSVPISLHKRVRGFMEYEVGHKAVGENRYLTLFEALLERKLVREAFEYTGNSQTYVLRVMGVKGRVENTDLFSARFDYVWIGEDEEFLPPDFFLHEPDPKDRVSKNSVFQAPAHGGTLLSWPKAHEDGSAPFFVSRINHQHVMPQGMTMMPQKKADDVCWALCAMFVREMMMRDTNMPEELRAMYERAPYEDFLS
jgi:hypothetical protein